MPQIYIIIEKQNKNKEQCNKKTLALQLHAYVQKYFISEQYKEKFKSD